MCRGAAPPRRLQPLRSSAPEASGPASEDDAGPVGEVSLEAGHHGLAGDGAELVGEGPVEDEDDHCKDPLADGGGVLQDETLVDEEDTA